VSALADGDILAVSARLRRLAFKLPIVRAEVEGRVAAVDGWPERGELLEVRPASDPEALTPTEAAASARLKHSIPLRRLELLVEEIVSRAASAEAEADRLAGYRIEVPRCTGGTGEVGAGEWGDPGRCPNLPERSGAQLCVAHRKAKNRWNKRQVQAAAEAEA
jgi:hypothetical protein